MATPVVKRSGITRELNVTEFDGNMEAIIENQTRSLTNQTAIDAIAQGTGATYATRALAMAEDPLPANGVPFVVFGETGFNGQYKYNSASVGGYDLITFFVEGEATPTAGSEKFVFSKDVKALLDLKANTQDVYDEYQYNSMMDVSNPSSGEFVNYNSITQVLTIPTDTVLLSKNGDDNINVVGEKTIDISAIASPVKIVYNTNTNVFRGVLATTDLDPLERVFCFVRKVNPDISINCGYSIDGVSVREAIEKPIVDYIRFGKYTTANKNLIDVSDTSKVYLVFDSELGRFEQCVDGVWGAVSDEEALDLKADKTVVDPIKEKTDLIALVTNGKFTITDLFGYIALQYDNTNGFDVAKVSDHFISLLNIPEVQDALTQIQQDAINSLLVTDDGSFKLMDLLGYIGLKYDNVTGFDVAKVSDSFKSKLQLNNTSTQLKVSDFDGDLVLHIVYGQSLAFGGSVSSAEDFYTAKMFTNGVAVNSSYIDVVDANNESTQETRFGGIVDMSTNGSYLNGRYITKKINELFISENGKDLDNFNHNLFGLVSGSSGAPWYQLAKYNSARTTQFVDVLPNVMPTALEFGSLGQGKIYLNLMQSIYFANEFAKTQGKKLIVGTLSYIQGEASDDKDNTITEFKAKLNELFDDISTDVTTITGQSIPVKFITYQNASFANVAGYSEGVPLASVEVSKDRTDTFFGTPLYPFSPPTNSNDLIHLENKGYAMMSSLLGIQAKRVINDNEPNLLLYPIENEIETWGSGSVWFTRIPFNVSVKPLVFDVDGVSGVNMRGHGLQTNFGFEILNGVSASIITEVKLSSDDAIVIETTENPSTFDLTYALTGVNGGGNLRDSQGDVITTSYENTTYRCDNWCPFFRVTL